MRFKVVLRRDSHGGGYVATCPALRGCVSQGGTKKEALANIREAIEGTLLELNSRARRPAPGEQVVEVEV